MVIDIKKLYMYVCVLFHTHFLFHVHIIRVYVLAKRFNGLMYMLFGAAYGFR